MTSAEIQTLLQKEFPNYQMKVESCENRHAKILLYIDNSHLRPGGTVSGPSMMLLADLAMYAAILNTIGSVVLAVTTNLNINFSKYLVYIASNITLYYKSYSSIITSI